MYGCHYQGIKAIQEVHSGLKAVIIHCSDVGWPLKCEPTLTETVCLSFCVLVWQLFSSCGFPSNPIKEDTENKNTETNQKRKNLCLASVSHHFRELVLFVFLVITLSNDHIGMSHFCLYYVAMTESNMVYMTYKHTQVQKLRLGAIWL